MKYLLGILLLFALLGACRSSGDRVKSNLKKAMQGYLHKIAKRARHSASRPFHIRRKKVLEATFANFKYTYITTIGIPRV